MGLRIIFKYKSFGFLNVNKLKLNYCSQTALNFPSWDFLIEKKSSKKVRPLLLNQFFCILLRGLSFFDFQLFINKNSQGRKLSWKKMPNFGNSGLIIWSVLVYYCIHITLLVFASYMTTNIWYNIANIRVKNRCIPILVCSSCWQLCSNIAIFFQFWLQSKWAHVLRSSSRAT